MCRNSVSYLGTCVLAHFVFNVNQWDMMKKCLMLIIAGLCMTGFSWGHDVRGIVVNSKQRPLKGVKVWKKNTTESVQTDKMGLFVFQNLKATDTLVISVSRKKDVVIPVDTLTRFSVRIDKKNYTLFSGGKEIQQEYVRKYRARVNSNILTHEQIVGLSANTIYDIFKGGAIPGVTVVGETITIRGGSSLSLDNEPLFVIDGTGYESSQEADSAISVNDIEKIEVLKDGSIYGARGANGAILITTVKK